MRTSFLRGPLVLNAAAPGRGSNVRPAMGPAGSLPPIGSQRDRLPRPGLTQPRPEFGRSEPSLIDRLAVGSGLRAFRTLSRVVHQIEFTESLPEDELAVWRVREAAATDPNVVIPEYAQRPFHGNLAGNDLWQALQQKSSMEAIALNFVGSERDLRPTLLSKFGPAIRPRAALVDLGAGTGGSLAALEQRYPNHPLLGVDLWPAMIAVGRHDHPEYPFRQAPAEQTGLPDASFGLVSIQALCHETPAEISRAVFAEAFRLVEPGGAIFFADMNPDSARVQRQATIGSAGRLVEPYLEQYLALDVPKALLEAGFEQIEKHTVEPGATMMAVVGRRPAAAV